MGKNLMTRQEMMEEILNALDDAPTEVLYDYAIEYLGTRTDQELEWDYTNLTGKTP